MKTKNCIKISSTGKGLNHWEKHLMLNQKKRLALYLSQLDLSPWDKRTINNLFRDRVTFDNIIQLHSHPIHKFLMHLVKGTLEELYNHSSINA